MGVYFKCPHCGRGSFDFQGETEIAYDKGLFRCENCGKTITLDDIIDYEEYAKLENLI